MHVPIVSGSVTGKKVKHILILENVLNPNTHEAVVCEPEVSPLSTVTSRPVI